MNRRCSVLWPVVVPTAFVAGRFASSLDAAEKQAALAPTVPSRAADLTEYYVDPVDTTGCGDVFHGAFCHGLAQGWPIDRIIPFANAVAAIKATRTGGWFAVPTRQEVQEILEGATR